MTLKIRQIDSKKDRKKFVMLSWKVFEGDSHWIAPLIMERLEFIDPKKNPFFDHGEAAFFLAERDGEAVGRISAHVNRLHNEHHKDNTGFFGFYECLEDEEASTALLKTAEEWLRKQDCDKVLGPISFDLANGEAGVQIKGFEHPLIYLFPYSKPYYAGLIEKAGYEKAKDLIGWVYDVGEVPEAPRQVADVVAKYPGLVVRSIDPKHMERDVNIVKEIFNECWKKNWGFVPWTEKEVAHNAKNLKMIVKKEITAIAEVNGEPAGMMFSFPNALELFDGLNGRLFPFGLLRLLWRSKFHKYKSARLALLGVMPKFRGAELGGLSVLMYIQAHRGGLKLGLTHGELGWTLEDNEKINMGIKFMGGRDDKIYRIYGKDL